MNVGRFSDQKNHAAILETMRLVHERDPLVRLLLVGGGSLRDDIERRIDRLGIRAVSALTSNRSDMGRLLAASDVFFFPSAWEGLPGAPLEALAAGLPLVSDIPSMREIAAYFPGDISMAPPNDTRQHAENIRRALDEPIDGARADVSVVSLPRRSRSRRRWQPTANSTDWIPMTQAEAPSSAERTLLFGAGVLALRKDDFLLAGFPRSGSTWTRHVLTNLISLNEWSGREVEAVLNETMPALGASNLFRPWPHSTIPRVIKTHHRYSPLFRNIPSIGIVRDPRDVMVSRYHLIRDKRDELRQPFGTFIRGRRHGLETWFRHYTSWRRRRLALRYEDMLADPHREFALPQWPRHLLQGRDARGGDRSVQLPKPSVRREGPEAHRRSRRPVLPVRIVGPVA